MTLNALLGAAGRMKDKDVEEFVKRVLNNDEKLVSAYRTKRDSYVFTNRRFIWEDIQGLTGKKRSLTSIPYSKISAFSVETAGIWDTDGELRLYVSGYASPLKLEFRSGIDIYDIQLLLSMFT
ncbi:MAG: PH domain-containing protein [Caldilineaceae bacterium]|nr:PH domain-containing protein [Caldilineaceae bacterium]